MERYAAAPESTAPQREWARCRHWIEEAIARGPRLENIEDVEQASAEYRVIFWAGEDNAAISRIDEYPNAKVMMITYAGGNLENMLHGSLDQVAYIAAGLGCDALGIECQAEHVPALRDAGFSEAFTTMLKPLSQQRAGLTVTQTAGDAAGTALEAVHEGDAPASVAPKPEAS